MSGGIMYQQSTSNKPKPPKEVVTQEGEEEQQKLLEMQSIPGSAGDRKKVAEVVEVQL